MPALLVHRGGSPAPPVPAPGLQSPAGEFPSASRGQADSAPTVSVYLTGTGAVETLPLEQYVLGVLAAEMPADFGIEALKAQAVASRTYIVKRIAAGDRSGVPGAAAEVTDTVQHQAYLPKAKLEAWKDSGKAKELQKLKQAVSSTAGVVMTYRDKPINALFFSASGGYTENSEDYWNAKIPYLRSVPSPWDASIDPDYKESVTLPLPEVFAKLGIKSVLTSGGGEEAGNNSSARTSGLPDNPGSSSGVNSSGSSGSSGNSAASGIPGTSGSAASPGSVNPPVISNASNLFQVLSRTAGHNIKTLSVAGQTFSGREIREKLGLRSSQFQIQVQGGQAIITTYGYGHDVGMSQWGANGMAEEGKTAKEILQHYYTGVSFKQVSEILKP